MEFTVEVRDSRVLLALRNGVKRQRYALSTAINTTLLAVQGSVPGHLKRQGFIVRKQQFFYGGGGRRGGVANKITNFAKPAGQLMGRIAVEASSVSSKRRLLLAQFETGGTRQPMTPGAKRVAAPILGRPARPSVAQGVPPEFSFAGLRLQAYSGGKRITRRQRGGHKRDVSTFGEFGRLRLPSESAGVQWKGRQRTFMLPQLKSGRTPGVFQRIGRGRGGIRIIYAFVAPPRLQANLRYITNAQHVVDRVFAPTLLAEVRKTLEFHGAAGATA
jgi:hypothetical protein